MSILIKGMEMPESCSNCELCACYAESKGDVYRCDITMYPVKYFEKRLDNCPLVEVPTPHGRLIDDKAVVSAFSNYIVFEKPDIRITWNDVYRIVCQVPTIIEAEVED